MLRLTVTVVQVMDDATVIASVHQEDPYAGPAALLGEVTNIYHMANLLDDVDELSALVMVLGRWAEDVALSTNR